MEEWSMARGHYGFQRRQREEARRAKQAAKRQRQSDKKEEGVSGPEMGEAQVTGADPGVWEWFSPSRSRTATSAPGGRPPADGPDDWVLLTDVDQEDGESSASAT
jgi:hypothetical protein